jgi:hypothetical protein
MNLEGLREFYRLAGFRVARTSTADYLVPGSRLYHGFPIGPKPLPAADEIAALCHHPGILGVEVINDRAIGVPGGLWALRDRSYGMRSLQRQFRQHVERAQATQIVREIGFDDLYRLGLESNLETLRRQHRDDLYFSSDRRWKQLCDAGRQSPGAGVFATFATDELTAYMVYFIVGDTCYGLFSKSRTEARKTGANHLLYFTYTQTMICRPGLAGVTAGLQTMPPLTTVDRFKGHAGYALEPHHTAVFVRPWFRELLQSRLADTALRVSARWLGPREGIGRVKAVREATRVRMSDLAEAKESQDAASGVVRDPARECRFARGRSREE